MVGYKEKVMLFLFSCFYCVICHAQQSEWRDLIDKKQFDKVISQAKNLESTGQDNFSKMFLLGQAYEGLLKYKDAYDHYKRCYSIDSTRIDMLNTLARIAGNLGKAKETEKYYKQVVSLDSTNFYANYQLSRLYTQTGNYAEGMKYVDFLLEKDPENPVLLRSKGDCYYNMDSLIQASDFYYNAFYYNVENASLASTLINLLLKFYTPMPPGNEYLYISKAVCDTALFYNPEDRSLLQKKALMCYMEGYYKKADTIFTSLMEMKDSSFITLKYCGFSRYNSQNWFDAIEPFEKAYAIDSTTTADVCILLGLSIGRTYDVKRAFEYFDKAEELMAPDEYWVDMLLQARAEMSIKKGECQKAAEYYYQLSKKGKMKLSMFQGLYNCYYRTGFEKMPDSEKERFLYICFWNVTEELKEIRESEKQNDYTLLKLRSMLLKYQEEMFFRSMKEYPMVSPDNKRSTLSKEKLKELLDKLPESNYKPATITKIDSTKVE